jgi:hypothetical protein
MSRCGIENFLKDRVLSLTVAQSAGTRGVMHITNPTLIVRLFAATLVTVATIGFSATAIHPPTQSKSSLTLKSIRTDKSTAFYADTRANRAWFVEMVLPTGHYADTRANRAWFVEMVLPTGDSKLMTENLKSVAATL